MDSLTRIKILKGTVIVIAVIVLLRLFYIQVIDDSYKMNAHNNVLRYMVQYPPRGEVYDRNGKFLVQSKEAYDLMAIPREVRPFDTVMMSRILGVTVEQIRKELQKASNFSRRRASVLFKQLPKEVKMRLEEHNFPGFFTAYRTVRSYPAKIAGNLLGYVGEVNDRILERNPYYRPGDYIGMSGIEQAYEEVLRGEKGVTIKMVDVHGIPKGSYADGIYDTLPAPGVAITCTIDVRLQALAEELMAGKVGSVVAIEPATGEILVMASSPTYDPDELVGRERGNNYMKLLRDPRRPLYNRAVMSPYPPGSTFKVLQGLIALQEGLLVPSQSYPCHGGYPYGRGVGCHSHYSPLDLPGAIQNSCNAYFCYVFRNLLENKKYKDIEEAFDRWAEYVRSFGYGRKLGSDFTGELNGNVPSAEYYDKAYHNRWNGLTVISLSIGQGELGCTPLQMANMVATVANRGHYRIPHVVKRIHDRDSIESRFYEDHQTMVEPRHFEPIVEGMYRAVNEGGTGKIAMVPGLEICGKTGTAQNPHGADHSTFFCFAPRNNPKIAVSVYVENGRFGATAAAPIASLITELYLTDTIRRPELVEYVKNLQIAYPYYERERK
ncbi:MAG: penicillin-binding protein 2 [Alistipes sp.]|nr:penicillin-binding protein 2 [Alistipes sp.]